MEGDKKECAAQHLFLVWKKKNLTSSEAASLGVIGNWLVALQAVSFLTLEALLKLPMRTSCAQTYFRIPTVRNESDNTDPSHDCIQITMCLHKRPGLSAEC